jgi:hypothetical protein
VTGAPRALAALLTSVDARVRRFRPNCGAGGRRKGRSRGARPLAAGRIRGTARLSNASDRRFARDHRREAPASGST